MNEDENMTQHPLKRNSIGPIVKSGKFPSAKME